MQLAEFLVYTFEQIQQLVGRTVRGLDADALSWRPDPQANSIAWLVWHLTRVEDSHIAEVAGTQQVWDAGWAERLGLPADFADTGYGHSVEQVGLIRPQDAASLMEYHDAVATMTTGYLGGLTDDDFGRVVDESYDPPVTLGVRMSSVIGDTLQHIGQAGYIRGLHDRRR